MILGAIGWFIAFIAQAVAQSNTPGRVSVANGVAIWFGIWVQIGVTIAIVLVLASDSIATSRFGLTAWLVIALITAVQATDSTIYSNRSSYQGTAAGWLICAAVDIIWLLFFTADEDSFVYNLVSGFGNGNLSGPGNFGAGTGGGSGGYGGRGVSSLGGGNDGLGASRGGLSNGGAYGAGGYSAAPYGATSQADLEHTGMRSAPSVRSGAAPSQSHAGISGGAVSPAPRSAAGDHSVAGGAAAAGEEGANAPEYGYKARALYAYQANADDPTEISFGKGEVLDIVDNSGKWWQARKSDGTSGIVPSNYMQLI